MRRATFGILCWLLGVSTAFAQDSVKVINPAEAVKRLNEDVTLLMEVKSANLRGAVCFLNSEENFRDDKNLTLFIDRDALARFKEAKIDDPAAHFRGKTVLVKGKVILYRDRPEIKLSGPDAIKIVVPEPASKTPEAEPAPQSFLLLPASCACRFPRHFVFRRTCRR